MFFRCKSVQKTRIKMMKSVILLLVKLWESRSDWKIDSFKIVVYVFEKFHQFHFLQPKNFKSRIISQNHCMHHKNFQKQQEKSSLKRFFATNWLLQHAHVGFILGKQTCRSNCVGLGQREWQVPLNFVYWTQKL